MLQHNFEFSACTSILVGKKAMADGSTVIGRNEDSKSAWPKHMVIHPRQTFAEDQTFVSKDNGFAMPLEKTRFKYSATPEWTDEFRLFEEDGINEYGVCMSATESAYANERVFSSNCWLKKASAKKRWLPSSYRTSRLQEKASNGSEPSLKNTEPANQTGSFLQKTRSLYLERAPVTTGSHNDP